MLTMHPDQVVPVSTLTRELWPEQPPVTALRTLQTYVLNIRKVLASITELRPEDVADQLLVTQKDSLLPAQLRSAPGLAGLHAAG
ncbi:hypothetical protein SHIRM173S_00674 [Streptomyces hirsutus]